MADDPTTARGGTVRSVQRAFAVVKAFGPDTPSMTLSEVAAATQGLSMASGSAVAGKPGTKKMAVGQLVAFFDKDKDRRGRK